MQRTNEKRILYKTVIFIETTIILFLLFTVSMLYSKYETTKEHIEGLIKTVTSTYVGVLDYLNKIYGISYKICLELNKTFNNRELALGFWIVIFIIFALSIKGVRKQLPATIKIVFSKKLMIWYFWIVSYFLIMILILVKLGFWNKNLLKDTIIWFFTVGIITSGKAIGKAKDLKYFIDVIKDNVKLLIIVEFISKLYSFSFLSELVLVLVVMFISLIIVLIDVKPELKNNNSQNLNKLLNTILAIIGFYILYHSVSQLIINIHSVNIHKLVKDMLLPPILSIMFILFTYFYVIYSSYEQLFIRLSFKKTINDKIRSYLTIQILLFCSLNIIRINNFILHSQIMHSYVNSKEDVKRLILNYKTSSKTVIPSIT